MVPSLQARNYSAVCTAPQQVQGRLYAPHIDSSACRERVPSHITKESVEEGRDVQEQQQQQKCCSSSRLLSASRSSRLRCSNVARLAILCVYVRPTHTHTHTNTYVAVAHATHFYRDTCQCAWTRLLRHPSSSTTSLPLPFLDNFKKRKKKERSAAHSFFFSKAGLVVSVLGVVSSRNMLGVSRCFLRPRAVRHHRGASTFQSLKRRLRQLKRSNDVAQATLAERRRLALLSMRGVLGQQQQNGTGPHEPHTSASPSRTREEDFTHGDAANAYSALRRSALARLPQNSALEASIAFVLHENRDARAELEFTRQLLNSTLLSLASPVAPVWDPYDVKPQVFALDTYLALPVFTSLEYVVHFCRRFGFTVRDPSGTLWVDGRADQASDRAAPLLLPDMSILGQSELWRSTGAKNTTDADSPSHSGIHTETTPVPSGEAASHGTTATDQVAEKDAYDYMSAEALFDAVMEGDAAASKSTSAVTDARERKKAKRRSKTPTARGRRPQRRAGRGSARRRVKQSAPRASTSTSTSSNTPPSADAEARARREAFMARVAAVTPFGIHQATPLPTFGPLIRPFFVGYFADVNTLLHNAAIVPDKVDIVVNPGSPIEFVLAREATNRILRKDQLLLHAYQRVERELQHEFSGFFARYCPGVQSARSACVPRPLDYDVAMQAVRAARRLHAGYDDGEDDEATLGHAGSPAERRTNPLTAHRERTRVLRESEYSNGVVYELVILIDCEDAEALAQTYHRLQEGKHRCVITGHPDLDVLPTAAAAPAVREAAKLFYQRDANAQPMSSELDSEGRAAHTTSSRGAMGVFRIAGQSQTINAVQPADSYFHDPTNAYTEAHAVFTEELKLTQSR